MQALIDAITLGLLALAIDVPWLYLNLGWSSKMIKDIQGSALSIRPAPALAIYLVIGLILSRTKSPLDAAIIGGATYAIYDLTNYATFANYDPIFAIVDILWGATLFGLTHFVAQKIGAFRPQS